MGRPKIRILCVLAERHSNNSNNKVEATGESGSSQTWRLLTHGKFPCWIFLFRSFLSRKCVIFSDAAQQDEGGDAGQEGQCGPGGGGAEDRWEAGDND